MDMFRVNNSGISLGDNRNNNTHICNFIIQLFGFIVRYLYENHIYTQTYINNALHQLNRFNKLEMNSLNSSMNYKYIGIMFVFTRWIEFPWKYT